MGVVGMAPLGTPPRHEEQNQNKRAGRVLSSSDSLARCGDM